MSDQGHPRQSGRRPRRWHQFGLSALLVFTALVAILLVWQRSRIDRWLAALLSAPPSAPADFITVVILPDRSVTLDGELVLNQPTAETFAARLQELRQAGVEQPKAIVCAHNSASMVRVREVFEELRQAGWQHFTVRSSELTATGLYFTPKEIEPSHE